MKKSKIVSVVLAVCLIMTCIPYSGKQVSAAATVTPSEYKTGSENKDNFAVHNVTVSTGSKLAAVPVKVSGAGRVDYKVWTDSDKSINVRLYSDAACTNAVKNSRMAYLYSSSTEDEGYAYVSSGKTYYLGFTSYSAVDTDVAIDYQVMFTGSGTKTLSANKWRAFCAESSSKNVYSKISISKPGYISVTIKNTEQNGTAYVTLCNKSKSALSEKLYVSQTRTAGNTQYFAVKKGTYYLRANTNAYGININQIKYTFKSVKDSSSNTKSKATTIKKGGAAKTGLIFAEDKTSKYDWYKVSLSKTSNLRMTLSGNTSKYIYAEIKAASSRVTLYGNSTRISDISNSASIAYTNLPKGTYYIRVYKTDKKSSGNYSLKVK